MSKTVTPESGNPVGQRRALTLVLGLAVLLWSAGIATPALGGPWQESDPATSQEPAGEEHAEEEPAGEQHSGEEHAGEQHAGEQHAGEEHAGEEAHGDDDHGSQNNFDYYLNKNHLIAHTADHLYFEIPSTSFHAEDPTRKISIPQISPWTEEEPLWAPPPESAEFLGPVTFQLSKFVVLELLAAAIVAVLFIWLANKVKSGGAPTGRLWNLLEVFVVYVRDQMAKPAIGSHDFKRFMPLIWTIFFFILTMNLMGMFPLLGTPTGNINVTAALALCVFAIVLVTGMKKLGVVGFWKAQAPHMDLPGPMKIPMTIGIWCIEVFGLFIKHMVLAVRLFANMFAGHMVLAVIVGFIGAFWGTAISWLVIPGSIGGSVAIGVLEVLVAFIQAYVFTFLTALFIGAAIHPH